MGVLHEFKEFAVKGNVMDMAVGVIIGGAFGKIVSSFVGDVIMPVMGVLIGGVHFSNLAITLKAASGSSPAVVIAYGKFVQSVVDFTIIAFVIFLAVKAINAFKRKKEDDAVVDAAVAEAVAEPSKEVVLLTEIRDLLKTAPR